jgi:hypothetical protein
MYKQLNTVCSSFGIVENTIYISDKLCFFTEIQDRNFV